MESLGVVSEVQEKRIPSNILFGPLLITQY